MTPSPSTSGPHPGVAPLRIVYLPRSSARRVLFLGVYFLFLAALLWFGGRLFWKWRFGVPLTTSASVWDFYFPELRTSGLLDAEIKADDGVLDVVLLGASTLERGWGNIEELLLEGLKREFGSQVRVFNLSVIAQTSRDSALKFSQIADAPFDVVLIYDGFNDCRMNCCPPELFRDDYTHCARYLSFEKRKQAGTIMLAGASTANNTIGLGTPEPDIAKFGAELKTPAPFERNLASIVKAVRKQHGLVVLNTFASHIPDDYTDEKLKRGELDFGTRTGSERCPLEMWGRKQDVVKCLLVHNQVIQELARQNSDGVVLIDQAQKLSADGRNFIDACHFTDLGCQRFVDAVLTELKPALNARLPDHPL